MPPYLHINYFAVFAGLGVEVLLGYFWYGRFFGNTWRRELGFSGNMGPMPSLMRRARWMRWVSLAVTILVVALAVEITRPSTWGMSSERPAWVYGLIVALATWAGFCLTPLLSRVAWEGASWRLIRIHGGYHLLGLLVVCQILAYWR